MQSWGWINMLCDDRKENPTIFWLKIIEIVGQMWVVNPTIYEMILDDNHRKSYEKLNSQIIDGNGKSYELSYLIGAENPAKYQNRKKWSAREILRF